MFAPMTLFSLTNSVNDSGEEPYLTSCWTSEGSDVA